MVRLLGMLAAWVLIAPVAAGQTVTRPQETSDGRAAQASDIVAVFRFANITREAADDWIGVGIAETVMADLDTRAVVSVISQEPIPSADGVSDDTAEPALAAGRRLGARWVVTGGYQRAGDQLRITGRLLETESGSVLSAAKVDGSFDQLFDLQDRIAAELTVGLLGPAGRAASIATRGGTPATTGRRPATGTTSTPGAAGDTATPAPAAGAVAAVVPARVPPPGVIDGPPPPLPPEVISRDAQGRATIRAVRLSEGIRLDGNLDEEVYRTVPPITDYVQNVPDVGQPATERTETWVLFDGSNLYIAARCYDSAPSSEWVADEMRRDSRQLRQNDTFGLMLDTFYDRRNGLTFYTNPLGAIADFETTNEGNPNSDWNPVWDVRTGRFDGGWTVEMEIPFKSLKYPAGVAQVWGIQLRRVVRRKNEWNYITRVPLSAAGGQGSGGIFRVSAAATLTSLEVPAGSNTLEIKPYAIGGVTTDRMADPVVDNDRSGDFGLDVKYGVTQNLTADFTYNTDFAQVEVDEQQVNLTRFSLFFPEKREFFLEGRGIFDFGRGVTFGGMTGPGGGGRPGGGGFFGGGYAPTIFFSRRIGLDGGQTVPILGGGRLTGKVGDFSVGALNIQTDDVAGTSAASTNFTVVRLKRDILRRSRIGGIFTGRSVSTEGDGSNAAFGLDAAFAFYDNVNLNGYYARTRTPGLEGDDESYQAAFTYNGDRYALGVDHLLVGDNFNPEIGFLRRDDFRRTFVQAQFSPRPASIDTVRQFTWGGSLDYILNGAGQLESRVAQTSFGTELENSDRFSVDVQRRYELLVDPFDISSDVSIPVGSYGFQDYYASYSMGAQRKISGTFSLQRGEFFDGDITAIGYSRGRIEITPQMSIEPSISVNRIALPGGRFTTKLATTRFTYTFTPRMFFSGLLQYNSSRDALSTNLRLRWEYQPGSELFVVYNDQRDTGLGRSFPMLDNRAFIVKFTRLFRF